MSSHGSHARSQTMADASRQVVFYGLPAAGVLCLALLKCSADSTSPPFVAQAMQDLNVLVAHVESGALVLADEPNYALLAEATKTIKQLLAQLVTGKLTQHRHDRTLPAAEDATAAAEELDAWLPWNTENENWEFELDFWQNLSEHPTLHQGGS